MTFRHCTRYLFLSTLSLRRATLSAELRVFRVDYFYPRSPCGERPFFLRKITITVDISIHALLAESDLIAMLNSPHSQISIHALLAESDSRKSPPMCTIRHFYPRSPCGERRWLRCWQLAAQDISIHALLAESDLGSAAAELRMSRFLSTLSLRRATAKVHKTVGHFCAYETNFMGIASSC